jgi:hypothetical protein
MIDAYEAPLRGVTGVEDGGASWYATLSRGHAARRRFWCPLGSTTLSPSPWTGRTICSRPYTDLLTLEQQRDRLNQADPSYRGAEIRTRDLTDPNGARYQAAPRPG